MAWDVTVPDTFAFRWVPSFSALLQPSKERQPSSIVRNLQRHTSFLSCHWNSGASKP